MLLPRLLKRNRFGFRLRRRSVHNRLMQGVAVTFVLAVFIYFLVYALRLSRDLTPPDYSWLTTRNVSVFVRPDDPDTVVLQPSGKGVCLAADRLRLVVVVHSSPDNGVRRRVVRQTWAKDLATSGDYPGVRVVFLLGRPSSEQSQAVIVAEHETYNDIVQQNFLDSYMNLTLKTTFMLKWILSNECQTAKFILKVDDDTFINPAILWENLEHALLYTTTTKSLSSYLPSSVSSSSSQTTPSPKESASIDYLLMGYSMPGVPIRDVTSKWYLPPKFYPLNIFPRFVSGSAYIFSTSIVPMLYTCALRTPYMNLEDVFLTGLCASTQLGLRVTHNPTFRFRKPLVGPNYICYYKLSSTVHPLDAGEMEEMYARLDEAHNCDTFYYSFVQIATSFLEFIKNLFRI